MEQREVQNRITIYLDGASHNKVGENSPMGIGIAVKINKEYREDLSLFGHFFYEDESIRGTSYTSEHLACREAMRHAIDLSQVFPDYKIYVFSDCQGMTRQFNREHGFKDFTHQAICNEAQLFAKKVGITEVRWIRREWNKEADILSKRGRHDNSIINVMRSAAE